MLRTIADLRSIKPRHAVEIIQCRVLDRGCGTKNNATFTAGAA